MSARPASLSEGFSSTPIKSSSLGGKKPCAPPELEAGVLSDDEDTFSLLSPIYHDSSDSDEDDKESPVRCELPKTPSKQMFGAASPPPASLGPWEMWLVNKMKEDRIRLEMKAEEERLIKEREEQEERQRKEKSVAVEEKIHEWLKMKREKERNEQLLRKNKELEEIQKQQEKQREMEQKAKQKYQDWLQKKNQEKNEKERKEKEEAALREEQEKERRRKAEEKFQEWLVKTNEKGRARPRSPGHPTSPYDKSYPSPSFYNPIPWKPIPVPPPAEASEIQTSGKKPPKQRRSQQSAGRLQRR